MRKYKKAESVRLLLLLVLLLVNKSAGQPLCVRLIVAIIEIPIILA